MCPLPSHVYAAMLPGRDALDRDICEACLHDPLQMQATSAAITCAGQVSPAPIENFPGLTGVVMPWDARERAQLKLQLRLSLSPLKHHQQKHRPKQEGFHVHITVI